MAVEILEHGRLWNSEINDADSYIFSCRNCNCRFKATLGNCDTTDNHIYGICPECSFKTLFEEDFEIFDN